MGTSGTDVKNNGKGPCNRMECDERKINGGESSVPRNEVSMEGHAAMQM